MAATFLSAEDAARWLALLRPSVRLVPGDDRPVARLGGRPRVPADFEWPEWPEHSPLSYLGELYCAELAQYALDIPLPTSGRLLLFYWDGSLDQGVEIVLPDDPASQAGARLIHLPDHGIERTEPDGLTSYPEQLYVGQPYLTDPATEHPDFIEAFGSGPSDRDWLSARYTRHQSPMHQIGGYSLPVQGAVEYEIAEAALRSAGASERPSLAEATAEADDWRLLFQLDSDGRIEMDWGGGGSLYWYVRLSDLEAGDLSRTMFAWQC